MKDPERIIKGNFKHALIEIVPLVKSAVISNQDQVFPVMDLKVLMIG